MEIDGAPGSPQAGASAMAAYGPEEATERWGSIPTAETQSPGDSCSQGSGENLSLRDRVLNRAAESDGHFKHQQRGEPDLTSQEKLLIVTDLLDNKPSVFLTRYGKYLHADDLEYFNPLKGDYTIDFYIKEIRQQLDNKKNQTKIRNRRYEAMKQLTDEGEYFGEEEMKQRDPLLYEQMVGQYLTDEEIQAQVDKSDLTFSNILLTHIQVLQNNEMYKEQKDIEASTGKGEDLHEL